jgi:LytS/YehU family sensor histidine kinase
MTELLFMLGVGSVIWYGAIIALPLLLLVARRIDLETRGRAQVAIGAIIALIVMLAATAAVDFAVTYRGIASKPQFVDYLPVVLRQLLLPWLAVAATVIAVEARRRGMQSRLERERLRGVVAEQRLVALTGQLQPHFLFNTLQGISTLIHRDPQAADAMLSKLSDLLRDLLKYRDSPVVKLEDELRYVRTYLEISKLRFADRLTFRIDSSPDTASAAVPLFILQPLVENALTHGIGTRARGGSITVRARRESSRLAIEIEDDGNGVTGSDTRGIGLTNTRERLNASFGDDGRLLLTQRNGSGTIARIDIPYRSIK